MLTPRLKLITEYVRGKLLADIGTDHAYIPIELVKTNKCDRVIATDISPGPLKIAQNNIIENGLHIETRIGAGLNPILDGEVQDIIIAGMGGKQISDILKENISLSKGSRLILQPMNRQEELRKFLLNNGFIISNEDLALEGFKVYNVIVCDKNEEPLIYNEEIDFHIPSFLKNHKYYKNLKDKKAREFTKIINGYKKSKNPDVEALNYYEELLQKIEK